MTTEIPHTAGMADVEEDRSVATLPTATDIEELVRSFRPLKDRVLIRLDEPPKMFGGLIHLPDNARPTERRWATVVRVGRDVLDLEPGDRVLTDNADPGWELAGGHRVLGAGAVMLAREPERS